MTKNLMAALAASAFLFLASAFPAHAAVIFSLTGVVGDANWTPLPFTDPTGPIIPGSFELYLPLPVGGQYGPGGLASVTYNGPDVYLSRDEEFGIFDSQQDICENPSGCVNQAGFVSQPDFCPCGFPQYVGAGGTSYTNVFDSTYYINLPDIPAFAPYGTVINSSESGMSYLVDDIVAPDAVGQAFSLTVSTAPEPSTWALMLAGFFGAGFALRRTRRKALLPAA
jgi:hypothetical protein